MPRMAVTAHSFSQALRMAHAAGWDEANRRAARERRAEWTAEDWDHAASVVRRVLHALGYDEQGSRRGGEAGTTSAATRFTH